MRTLLAASLVLLFGGASASADICTDGFFSPGCTIQRAVPKFAKVLGLGEFPFRYSYMVVGVSEDGKPKLTEVHVLACCGSDEDGITKILRHAEPPLAALREELAKTLQNETCAESPMLSTPGVIDPPQLARFVQAGGVIEYRIEFTVSRPRILQSESHPLLSLAVDRCPQISEDSLKGPP